MASSKNKTTLRKPKSGRAYSGFGGAGLDQMYRIGSLAYPFSGGRWTGGGAAGGGGGGWSVAPGGPSGGQDWAAPAYGGDYGAYSAAGGDGSAPVRELAPMLGQAPVVTNIPRPTLPVGGGGGGGREAPTYTPVTYTSAAARPPAPPTGTPVVNAYTGFVTGTKPLPAPAPKPATVQVGSTTVPTALANLLGAASAKQVQIATGKVPPTPNLPTRLNKGVF